MLAINECVPVVLLNRGICLARLERLREAVEAFTRVLDIDPRDVAAWHNKGLALARLGQDDEAKYCFARGRALIRPAGVAGGAALTVRAFFPFRRDRDAVLAVDPAPVRRPRPVRDPRRARAAIAAILRRYSPRDLSQLGRNFREKFQDFDRAYRDRLTGKVAEAPARDVASGRSSLRSRGRSSGMTATLSPDSLRPAYTAMVLRRVRGRRSLVHRATR